MKYRMGFVSNSSSSSFIAGYGFVPDNKKEAFEGTMKSLGIVVNYESKDEKWNLLDFFFPTAYTKNLPDEKYACIHYEGDEGSWYWYDHDEDEARDINWWDKPRRELIKHLENGTFFDKTKPFDYKYGVWHS